MLVSAVPRDLVDEAVAVCGVREERSDGKLPAHVATYLTLALSLFPDDDYREVATKVWSVPVFIDTGLGCQIGEFSES